MTVIDVTTVSDTEVVVHRTAGASDGTGDAANRVSVHRFDHLAPDTDHTFEIADPDDRERSHAIAVRTLPTPSGELQCTFATVNDVHFGELVAGQIDELEDGPVRRSEIGSEPYPEVMNRAAVDEIATFDPDAVIVKGDLSLDGHPDEWAAFEQCYRNPFGDLLHVVRGNHDGYRHQDAYAGDRRIELDGITIALLDTVIPGATTGDITEEQIAWLDDVVAATDQPVMVMGHHQQWIADPDIASGEAKRSDDYFGLHPDASERLDAACARHPKIIAYSAGHTHRHRVRAMSEARIPSIEVGCTKDFPGTWAEHRVYDGGVMQVVHRMSSAEALAWSESCRHLYADFGIDYETYALGGLTDRCFVIPITR